MRDNMNSNYTTPAGALLVGSVPLKTCEEVFTSSSQILGNHLPGLLQIHADVANPVNGTNTDETNLT